MPFSITAVLPSEAHAKITFRLVAGQSPDRVYSLLEKHVADVAPVFAPGLAVSVFRHNPGAPAYSVDRTSSGFALAKEVLTSIYDAQPKLSRSGGSVNAYADFSEVLQLNSISFGFGTVDSYQHAPDERFRLESLHLGQRAYLKMMIAAAKKYGDEAPHTEL